MVCDSERYVVYYSKERTHTCVTHGSMATFDSTSGLGCDCECFKRTLESNCAGGGAGILSTRVDVMNLAEPQRGVGRGITV
jgi:hypothetical protein